MKIDEAVRVACKEPTLLEALTWICIWESERAIKQAIERPGTGVGGAGWETHFGVCLSAVMEIYPALNDNPGAKTRPSPLKHTVEGGKILRTYPGDPVTTVISIDDPEEVCQYIVQLDEDLWELRDEYQKVVKAYKEVDLKINEIATKINEIARLFEGAK